MGLMGASGVCEVGGADRCTSGVCVREVGGAGCTRCDCAVYTTRP